jgi:Na+/H+-dicarboxylate symporter
MTDTATPVTARLYRLALNPWLVLACLLAGAGVGAWQPQWASRLGVVGVVYVDLLQMIVLPFMVSAVIFSLQHLFREGGASRTLARVIWVFGVFAAVVAAVGLVGAHLAAPGADLPNETRAAFGRIIGSDVRQSSAQVTLRANESDTESSGEVSLREVLGVLVPSNVFAAFAQGEALKALVFALLFGFAAGQVPGRVSQGLIDALETVYTACQTLTRWFNLPVPLVLFCMAAAQIGQRGFDTLRPMAGFVLTFIACAALLVVMAHARHDRVAGRQAGLRPPARGVAGATERLAAAYGADPVLHQRHAVHRRAVWPRADLAGDGAGGGGVRHRGFCVGGRQRGGDAVDAGHHQWLPGPAL